LTRPDRPPKDGQDEDQRQHPTEREGGDADELETGEEQHHSQ
jgi:hypothetical protein